MPKKIFIIISIYLSLIFSVNANIDIKARTAILQDFLSGEILYEKDPDRSIYPASMTKIMTSIIALANLLTESIAAATNFTAGSTVAGLNPATASTMDFTTTLIPSPADFAI